MPRKRNQPTIPTPDREEVQRRREGQGQGDGLGVATRAVQKAQDKYAEDNKVTCLDFGADRHREWKDHGADLCDQCDKYDNLVSEKKNNKRRINKQYWCTVIGNSKGCPATSAGNWFYSHCELLAPVPPEVPTPHNNPLVNESFGNNGVTASPMLSRHVPRELRDNPPKDITAMSTGNMTPPPSANALTLQSAAPSSTATRCSWSQVIAKDAEIQRLNMQLCLKNKHSERLDTYIGELNKKVRANLKTKANYKAQIDRLMGVAPIANNQQQAAINHKEEFENDLRACLKDSCKRLSLSTKAFMFGKVLQDKCFMNGVLFKQSMTIMRIFYHDTVFPNHKVLAAMDERVAR
jgi:hypothetical protein